jgi:hypothetical protein
VQGHFKILNFSTHPNGCVNLDGDWDGQVSSIDIGGHCINVFDEFNCTTTSIGKNLSISTNTTQAHLHISMSNILQQHKLYRVVQSLKLCNEMPIIAVKQTTTSQKLVGGGNDATNIIFIVTFSLVFISICSVGLAFLFQRFSHVFRLRRDSWSSQSIMF